MVIVVIEIIQMDHTEFITRLTIIRKCNHDVGYFKQNLKEKEETKNPKKI
jgi:hypothetical protein